jgi:hypothetical protein
MFGSLDFVYVPTSDVDAAAAFHVEAIGAELVWKVRAMGTTVAALRLAPGEPLVLLAGHVSGERPILVYRVTSYPDAVADLRRQGVELVELEIPHGPCATFTADGGQRYAVYELVRPEANEHFVGRVDP